jgi:hypothetical protein
MNVLRDDAAGECGGMIDNKPDFIKVNQLLAIKLNYHLQTTGTANRNVCDWAGPIVNPAH